MRSARLVSACRQRQLLPCQHVHAVAASGFDADGALYDRARPSYPDAAMDHIFSHIERPRGELKVLDLAAGTGILTRRLLESGVSGGNLTAVEPVEEMRRTFATVTPGIEIAHGTAEALPFDDGTFDLVTVGQAFHWFANKESLREIARCLRADGGVLALAWNLEDASVPWVSEVRNAYERHDDGGSQGDVPQYRKGAWVDAFTFAEGDGESPFLPGAPERSFFEHSLLTTRDEQWERANSKSYIQNLPEGERTELEAEIRGIMDRHASVFSHVRGGDDDDDGAGKRGRERESELCAELPIRCEVAIARRG